MNLLVCFIGVVASQMSASGSSISFGYNLSQLTKKDLVEELTKRNLKITGTKGVLITRLKTQLKKESQELADEATNKEMPNPETNFEKISPKNAETDDISKEDDSIFPPSGFLSPDYENIDSAQGSPELDKVSHPPDDQDEGGDSFSSPRDITELSESVAPQESLNKDDNSYFEQIDSTSETGDQEFLSQENPEYEVLSDRENSEDYEDFENPGDGDGDGDSFEQDMTEFIEIEGDESLPCESELLLYEDEPVDQEMEVTDSQKEELHIDPIDKLGKDFQVEGQEPISPCESHEDYPVVLQEMSEKKEPKPASNQSNEDEVVLDVGGENLDIENVNRKEKVEKSKEVKKQDPNCNLWISNLSEETRASVLKNKFTAHGNVISAKIVANASKSGEKNKFFGYVIMSSAEEAAKCIEELNNSEIDGKQVTVEIAKATLPNVVSRSGRLDERDKYSDRGDSGRSGRRDNFQGRRIILVSGDSGQKLVRIRDDPHSGSGRAHYSSARQVREVRHRSASPRDRRISIERRNRFSPPPSFRGMHSSDQYRRRVISRDYPISSRGVDSKNYASYRGRGTHHDSGYGHGIYPSPRIHHSMRGVGMHGPRSFDTEDEKSRRDEDKRRMVEEIRRHEKLENEIRKREQREKERLLKSMHEREAVKEQEFRERERLLHEREQSERERRLLLEETLRSTVKRERELLKEKEMQSKVLQDRERLLAKRDKDAQNLSHLQDELVMLEQKQKDEKNKLEMKLKEYQNREKRFEIEQQERHRKEIEAKERLNEAADQERRMKESKKRFEDMPIPRQPIKRPFEEPRRDYSEKRVRDDPHTQFYPSEDNQRWKEVDKHKGSVPAQAFRPDTYAKRGTHHPQHSTHSPRGTRYSKQSDEYYEGNESGNHSFSTHATRPYSARGTQPYRGRSFPPRHSDSGRSYESKKMRDHSPPPQDRYSYPRSERHSISSTQTHKSHSDSRGVSRSGPPSGSSGMGGRQNERYVERHSSGKNPHRETSDHGMQGEWHSRSSYGSGSGQQGGYSEQRILPFDKLPRPPMPSFSLPPTPVLPGAPGGFMVPGAIGHSAAAAAALLTSFGLQQQQGALRGQAPFQGNFHPNYRQ